MDEDGMADTSWLDWAARVDKDVEGGGCLRGKVNRGGVRWDVMEEMRERGNHSLVGAASRKLPAMGTRAGAMTREGKRKSARGASRHVVAPERGATGT